MSPGGHLVTTAVAAGVGLAATGSVPFAAGIVVGGFLIDVDHAVDYLIVERQRELTPAAFLRYYTEGRADRKSTRLNSSHQIISYAVFCLKKKNKPKTTHTHKQQDRCSAGADYCLNSNKTNAQLMSNRYKGDDVYLGLFALTVCHCEIDRV